MIDLGRLGSIDHENGSGGIGRVAFRADFLRVQGLYRMPSISSHVDAFEKMLFQLT